MDPRIDLKYKQSKITAVPSPKPAKLANATGNKIKIDYNFQSSRRPSPGYSTR